MNAVALGSPLKKLLRATRGDVNATKGPSHQALRLAISRAGRQALDADLLAEDISFEQIPGAESLVDPLAEFALVGKLVSASEDAGIVAADRHAVAAITSLRTTGHLPSYVPERGASIVESALAQPLLTGIVTAWAMALEADKDADARLIHGYHAAGKAQSVRSLAMSIPQGALNLYRVDLAFGGSAKGKLVFAFPTERLLHKSPTAPEKQARDPKVWTQHFSDELREAPTRVDAILLRRAMSVTDLRGLHVGQLLAIPQTALNTVTLVGTQGAIIGHGRLGQLSGYRAIRLNEGRKPAATQGGADAGFEAPGPERMPHSENTIGAVDMGTGSGNAPDAGPEIGMGEGVPMALDL